ncbi:MAG: hypothetical protein R3F43_03425 [bacterium]
MATFLHVYTDPFDPAGVVGCIIGDDDFGNPAAGGSQILDLNIAAGQVLVVVPSTFAANANIGAYTIDVFTQPIPGCGNAAVEAGEECDDGNLANGDGCDSACSLERFDVTMAVARRIAADSEEPSASPSDAGSVLAVTGDGTQRPGLRRRGRHLRQLFRSSTACGAPASSLTMTRLQPLLAPLLPGPPGRLT